MRPRPLLSSSCAAQAIKAEQSRKFADGSVSGLLELKYTDSAHGLTIKDTWDTKNVITSEVALDNKSLHGNKITVTKASNNGGSWFGRVQGRRRRSRRTGSRTGSSSTSTTTRR